MTSSSDQIFLTQKFSAHNYAPLEVVLAEGRGVWLWDVDGHKYLDMLAAYSAMNFGHGNPRLLAAAEKQLKKLTLASRAFYNDQLGEFCKDLAALCGMQKVLPVNTGVEAVETALKAARKWGYEVKGVEPDQANIICFENNFAGRTISVVSFSTSSSASAGFGPLTPGFRIASFSDIATVERQIDKNTVAVLIEPIQGEGGVLLPPAGFLADLRKLCDTSKMLLIADEIQTGLCRTGKIFACEHEGVTPDMYILGKSLGGGIIPVSAVISSEQVMGVFTPGTHGSTFGGNPLGCAIGREVMSLIKDERPHEHALQLGDYFMTQLRALNSPHIGAIRGRGLMIGVDIRKESGPAKDFCKVLKKHGLLCKDTREQTIRFTPPLVIDRAELDFALQGIKQVFSK